MPVITPANADEASVSNNLQFDAANCATRARVNREKKKKLFHSIVYVFLWGYDEIS